MESGCCCCYSWLLWTVLIVILHPHLEVSGAARECPQGQLLHVPQTRPGYFTCCLPTRCDVGEEVMPCKINGTQDTCQICGAFQNQSLRTSSFTMERCTDWPLDRNCKSINNPDRPRDFRDERTKRCMCNIEQGKRFDPPESAVLEAPMDSYCQRRNDPCRPGFEPQVDGGCVPCKDNYFKSVEGFRLCEPKTNCPLLGLEYKNVSGATADNNCSEPVLIVTTKSSHPHKPNTNTAFLPETTWPISGPPSTTPALMTSTESFHHFNTSLAVMKVTKNEDSITWPIVGAVIFLVCVLALLGLVMVCRRRGLSIRICRKDINDPEKSMQGNHMVKHSNGTILSRYMIDDSDSDKVFNNNVNGTLLFTADDMSNGHANGHISLDCMNSGEHGNPGLEQYNNRAYQIPILARPGSLASSNRNVVFGQRRDNLPDMVSDLGPEKLRVSLVANKNVGENDCLLVSGYDRGASGDDIQNWPVPVGRSTSPILTCVDSGQIFGLDGRGQANFGHVNNNLFLPLTQPQGEAAVVCSPTTDMVIFTRSGSVITSPVDDVDDHGGSARIPRFSQLLQDGEDVSSAASTDTMLETRILNPPVQVQGHNNKTQHQQTSGVSADPVESEIQGLPLISHPGHYIMNLKEQDLVDNEQAVSMRTHSDTELKTVHQEPLISSSGESQQTDPKTLTSCDSDKSVKASSGGDMDSSKQTRAKQLNISRIPHSLGKNKIHSIGEVKEQTFNEKKKGMSNKEFKNNFKVKQNPDENRNQNIQERFVPESSQLKSCVKTSSHERDSDKGTPHLYHRLVSFEENDSVQSGNKHQDTKLHHRPTPQVAILSEKVASSSVNRAPHRSVPDVEYNRVPQRSVPDVEQTNVVDGANGLNGTEWRSVHHKNNMPNGAMKGFVNCDVTSSDDSSGSKSPSSVVYRRSQSQTAPAGSSSSDPALKTTTRSMSEEKQQRMDRPVAKVKPMPTSDSAVNQLPPPPPPQVVVDDDEEEEAAVRPAASGTNTSFGPGGGGDDTSAGQHDHTVERHSSPSMLEDESRMMTEEDLDEGRA